jgi:hypothetical protein
MSVDKKILKEIQRYHSINKYITEQEDPLAADVAAAVPGDVAVPEAPATPEAGVTPEAPATPQKIDVATDDEVTKIDDGGESDEGGDSGTEEIDVTDIVKTTEKIDTKQDKYFEQLFGYIQNLETKLSEMDNLVEKLNSIETKIEKYREKTPQEKLQLRSLDSGPFNQKLSDFFEDKKEDFEKTGKHEYILTADDVEDINPAEIKKTFNDDEEDEIKGFNSFK